MLKIKIIKEVYSDRQRKYMCAMKEPDADRPEGLSQSEAEEMCTGPMKEEEKLDEISAMAGGAVAGASGALGDPDEIKKFNEKEKKKSKLKNASLEEKYSTVALQPGDARIYMDDEVNNGRIERSKHQGLKNVKESKSDYYKS